MSLTRYEELTDFQKWLFFYIAKEGYAPTDLQGVMPKMCMTVRMKIDVDNYENETKKLIVEANTLAKQGLMQVTSHHVPQGEFVLTDKGELYLLQKIMKPLIEIKDKKKQVELRRYLNTKDEDVRSRVEQLLGAMVTDNPQKSIMDISTLVLSRAMPFISAFNLLHQFAKEIGLY